MKMEPLEQIKPSQAKDFFLNLCEVSKRYAKKHHAIKDLDSQLEKIKKYSKGKLDMEDIPKLKSKINEVLESERKILAGKGRETEKEKDLIGKIRSLEHELEQTRKERDIILQENREKIHELNVALLSVKTRMEKLIEHKREREKRIMMLEKKISKKVN